MADATSLGFLETVVRHSRHYDISLQFVTQTGGEFTLTPEAKTIADPVPSFRFTALPRKQRSLRRGSD